MDQVDVRRWSDLDRGGTLLWRASVQNAVTYQTVAVERGSIQARVTASGTLNAVVDVVMSSQVSCNT
jgi:hypothetical protein